MPTSPTRTEPVKIGSRVFNMSSDDTYLDHIGDEFEPSHVEMLRTLISPHDVVLDIGANIGCTALLFAQLSTQVIAFEPGVGTCRFLRHNVEAAGFQNVKIENIGLGSEDATLSLVASPTNRAGAFISNFDAPAGHPSESVTIERGDYYVERNQIKRVDYIKIDTEGFEQDVIEGLRSTLLRDRPVVTMELNHWCLNAFQRTSVPDFLDFLRGVFPCLYAVDQAEIRNLHDPNDSYLVMHEHIVRMRFREIVAAFDEGDLSRFHARYAELGTVTTSPPVLDQPAPDDAAGDPGGGAEATDQLASLDVEAYEARLADLNAHCEAREIRISELLHRCASLESELSRLLNTRTWRYTRPLRTLRAKIGGS